VPVLIGRGGTRGADGKRVRLVRERVEVDHTGTEILDYTRVSIEAI
jgi:hypothetical protein